MTATLRHAEQVMGTVFSFDVRHDPQAAEQAGVALAAACTLLHEIDATFSTWKPDSAISRLRRHEAIVDELPPEVADVLELCATAKRATRGWFDPWALPGGVDPTGIVKGWAVARALACLREGAGTSAGISAAMVNGGGDIAVFGEPEPGRPWSIGIRDPAHADELACVAEVHAAIATSGSYERPGEILDPHTGTAAALVGSASVVGPDLALADALATALVAGGVELLPTLEQQGYAACLIEHDGTVRGTPGFPFARPGT